MSERQQKWLYVLPFALALGALLPFLDKAFTIDDPLFLYQAQQSLKDPLHPTSFDVVWSDNKVVRCSSIMPSGPVQAFLLIPTLLLGASERVAHASQLLVLLAGIAATLLLARDLGLSLRGQIIAGAVVAVSPCVVGMTGTAMPDVPAMTLGTWGLFAALRWRNSRRWPWLLATLLFVTLAALARPHGIGFVGLVFLLWASYDPSEKPLRRFAWRLVEVLPLAVVPLLVVLWGYIARDTAATGGNLAKATQGLATLLEPDRHFVAFFSHWALTTPLALLVPILRRGRLPWVVVGTLALPFGVLVAGLGFFKQTWVGPLCALSLAALIAIWFRPRLADRSAHFAFSVALLMPLGLMVYVHLPCKYLATSVPAAAILLGAEFDAAIAARLERPLIGAAIATIALFSITSMLVLAGDAAYGRLSQRAVAEFVKPNVDAGRKVWLAGHWGFQWYGERAGGTVLTLDSHPAPGDLLVFPSKNHDGAYLPDQFLRRAKLDRLYDNESKLHTMHHGIIGNGFGAGFYSNWWGLLPVVIGRAEMEQWELWEFTYSDTGP